METNLTKQKRFRSSYTADQYKNAVRAAYKLGFMDAQQKHKELFLLLQKTNHRLWEELIELDKKEPVNGIALTAKQVRSLVRHLCKMGLERNTAEFNET